MPAVQTQGSKWRAVSPVTRLRWRCEISAGAIFRGQNLKNISLLCRRDNCAPFSQWVSRHSVDRSMILLLVRASAVAAFSFSAGAIAVNDLRSRRLPSNGFRKYATACQRLSGGGSSCTDDFHEADRIPLVPCLFRIKVPHTMPGDTVKIVGGAESIGNWHKDKALTLTTSKEDFPWY